MPEYASFADKVAANDDLLTEILIRLPTRSLMRFKSVSKHWFFLISNRFFAICRNPYSSAVFGLFLHTSWSSNIPKLDFTPLNNDKNPTDDAQSRAFTIFPGLLGIRILNSCHGILVCFGDYANETNGRYIILNPITKEFRMLPEPHVGLEGLSLALDPSRSPHYEVVCVWSTVSVLSTEPDQREIYYQIEIYSSETNSWRASGEPFARDTNNTLFNAGVYWNGAINWFSIWGDSLYFNIDQERLGTMPMLPVPEGNWYERKFRHFGESRGHLHLVEIYGPVTHLNVYEMDRDYSGWFVKYHVDLDVVGNEFPEMMQRLPGDPTNYSFAILSLVREEKDELSFLVLHIPDKVIHYNLRDKTFKKICDVALERCDYEGVFEDSLRYFWFHAYPYIESLTCV